MYVYKTQFLKRTIVLFFRYDKYWTNNLLLIHVYLNKLCVIESRKKYGFMAIIMYIINDTFMQICVNKNEISPF